MTSSAELLGVHRRVVESALRGREALTPNLRRDELPHHIHEYHIGFLAGNAYTPLDIGIYRACKLYIYLTNECT